MLSDKDFASSKLFHCDDTDMVIRKPAQYSDGLPMYLCIVIGKPRVKLPDVTYPAGKKAVLQSKYWFSISRQRYAFHKC